MAIVAMSVGSSVGSWRFSRFTLGCLVTELPADVASAAKSGSGAKLHRSVTMVILLNGNGYRNMEFALNMLVCMSYGDG